MEIKNDDLLSAKNVRKKYGRSFQSVLQELAEIDSAILAAQVCTSDGFEVASVHRDSESHRRLAAMVSSLYAVGAAMVQESSLGNYANMTIEASEGKCLIRSIPGSNDSLLLVAVASPSLLFGMFHTACTKSSVELGKCLSK